MRVILDTNVLVSGLLEPTGTPAAIVQAWEEQRFTFVSSLPLLDELERVLARPHIARRLWGTPADAADFLERVRRYATLAEPHEFLYAVDRDPDDNRVLEAAVAGEADYIVTGDRDLLELADYKGISIVTPAQFLALRLVD